MEDAERLRKSWTRLNAVQHDLIPLRNDASYDSVDTDLECNENRFEVSKPKKHSKISIKILIKN